MVMGLLHGQAVTHTGLGSPQDRYNYSTRTPLDDKLLILSRQGSAELGRIDHPRRRGRPRVLSGPDSPPAVSAGATGSRAKSARRLGLAFVSTPSFLPCVPRLLAKQIARSQGVRSINSFLF